MNEETQRRGQLINKIWETKMWSMVFVLSFIIVAFITTTTQSAGWLSDPHLDWKYILGIILISTLIIVGIQTIRKIFTLIVFSQARRPD